MNNSYKYSKDMVISWLVVSTHLKNISQIGNLPQMGVKIKKIETTTQFLLCFKPGLRPTHGNSQ